ERMRKEAEMYAEEDRKKKELAEARNQADSLIYSTEKTMKDFGDKITDAEKEELNRAIEDLRSKMSGNDIEAIKRAMEELTNRLHKVTSRLYSSGAQSQAQGTQGAQGAENTGNTIDANFREASGGSQ
ncbi:MAG: Hsp70 family protein, partial [Clostridia bacterium]|nr:Hsp70 family protein [Clostridia bacterium]